MKSTSRLLTPSTGPCTRKRGRPLTPVENVAKKPTAQRELKVFYSDFVLQNYLQ